MTPRTPLTALRPVIAASGLVLALALAGCGGDDTPPTTAAPGSSVGPTATDTASESNTPSPTTPVGPSLDITVQGDTIDPSNQRIDAKAGDTLVLNVTSDRSGEVHVHTSPEQELEFGKGTTELKIELQSPGQVDVEEHESDTLIARVLVK